MSDNIVEIRKLNAARGWIWVKHGYQLIMHNPLLAISLALIGSLVIFATLLIPLVGPLLALLVMPVLIAGYMRVCRALEENEEVELKHLFAGFGKHVRPLVSLGGYLMLAMLAVSMAMIFIGGEALTKLLEAFQASQDTQVLMQAMMTAGGSVGLSLLLGFTAGFALMLAFQYAPMLVFFSNVAPITALRASLAGSLRNIIPYTVYNLIIQVIALLLGILPFGIGVIVFLPLAFTSLYVSYRNIFPFPGEIPPGQ